MKSIIIIASITLFSILSCDDGQTNQIDNSSESNIIEEGKSRIEEKEQICIDNQSNKWSYHNKFEIELPKGYYFSSSLICNSDSIKIGEVSATYELLKTELNGKKFFDFFRNGGEIVTDNNHYYFNSNDDENEINIIKYDSIIAGKKTWYYVVFELEYEGENDYGYWNAFDFCNIENKRYTGITFYNRDLKDLDISKYVEILRTLKYKN